MSSIVFDLDGTLIDSAPDIRAAANKMLDEQGLEPLDLPTIVSFIGNGLPKLTERVMNARGLDLADHACLTEVVLNHYNAASSDLTVPYPGVMEALEGLKNLGFRMGVCTNKPEAPARAILEDMGMMPYFDAVVGGDSLDVKKPDRKPLIETFNQLGAQGGLYVGDSEVDAETAVNAGQRFALFTEGYRKTPVTQVPHDYQFSEFSQLVGIAETSIVELAV